MACQLGLVHNNEPPSGGSLFFYLFLFDNYKILVYNIYESERNLTFKYKKNKEVY